MTPRPTNSQASAPGLLFSPPPRRPPAEQPLQSRRAPLAAALFFPHFPGPSYNARYMRPFDSLTRPAASWGWQVAVSAFALLTPGLVMVLWWGATTEDRTSPYLVRGTVNGITL